MKLLFFFSVVDRFYARVAADLARSHPEWRFSGICFGRQERDRVLELGPAWDHLEVLSEHLRSAPDEADLPFLEDLEARLTPLNLPLMAHGDWFVKEFPRARMLVMIEVVARMLLRLLDEGRPDVVVAEGVDCVSSYLLFALCRERGIPMLVPGAGRLPDRTAFVRNNEDEWERTGTLFQRYLDEGIPGEVRGRAEAFISEFRSKHLKPGYYRTIRKPRVSGGDLSRLVRLWKDYRKDPDNYISYSPGQLVAGQIKRITRRILSDRFLFEEPSAKDRFVLFPLHFQPEATTLVLAPFFEDQIALIRSLAISLPVGCVLYVKEHGYSVGRRPLSYYRTLKAIPNVKLITPYLDSHPLIRDAAAIATITGTMGWEALLYGKPVITFGKAFYNASGLVDQVQDLYTLPKVLRSAVVDGRKHDPERLLAFVAATLEGTHPGVIAYRNSPPEFYGEENVHHIAQAIESEVLRVVEAPAHMPDRADSSHPSGDDS